MANVLKKEVVTKKNLKSIHGYTCSIWKVGTILSYLVFSFSSNLLKYLPMIGISLGIAKEREISKKNIFFTTEIVIHLLPVEASATEI